MSKRLVSSFARKAIESPLNYVNGRRIEPDSTGRVLGLFNPATGVKIGETCSSSQADVNSAVENSLQVFKQWRLKSPSERAKVLLVAAQILKERLESLAEVEVLNNGKAIWEARWDVEGCVDSLQYFAALAEQLNGEHVSLPNQSFGYTVREPLGVVGSIGAWNYPFQIATWKSAPAIVCGNSVVFKPSELSPVTAVLLAEIYSEAGLPPGVFNVVQGYGDVGGMLCSHPDITKISFTGSVPTGIKIMKTCAESLKHVTLELGGKSALVVFEDCCVEEAVKGAIVANFLSQGQVCSNGTRVYVHDKIYEEFKGKLVQKVAGGESSKGMLAGDPMSEDTRVGASISKQHFEKVTAAIEAAKKEGAKVVCGGERVLLEGELEGGYYMSPCILEPASDHSSISKQEVFGAVMCLYRFHGDQEVVDRANDSEFGLAAGLFTRDLHRAHSVASSLQAGTVWVNNYNLTAPQLPFGGVKSSGLGRENGKEVLNYYTNTKSVYVEMKGVDCPF